MKNKTILKVDGGCFTIEHNGKEYDGYFGWNLAGVYAKLYDGDAGFCGEHYAEGLSSLCYDITKKCMFNDNIELDDGAIKLIDDYYDYISENENDEE
jgi:hypothetical protein